MARRFSKTVRDFFATESAGGIALAIAACVALFFANSPMHTGYADFWKPIQPFISDGLMSIFFFLVGLEIKREFHHGELRNPKAAALPIIAALGGMLTPALIYAGVNRGGPGLHSWAVPMPTDIALAIGALALLGSRVDPAIKIFLLTLAIADDLGSLVIMGLFYSSGISPYKVLSTFGAIALAWAIPNNKVISTDKMISLIHPWSSFIVIPVFALANIGITVDVHHFGSLVGSPIASGIIIGRVIGKLLGITLFAWVAVKIGIARLPKSLSFGHIAGAGALGGMGLTVSLYIAELSTQDATQMAQMKVGLILAALISAMVGLFILRRMSSR